MVVLRATSPFLKIKYGKQCPENNASSKEEKLRVEILAPQKSGRILLFSQWSWSSCGCLICIFSCNYFPVWMIGHPETKLLMKQKHITLLKLLSLANCLLEDNLYYKTEFLLLQNISILHCVRWFNWEMCKNLFQDVYYFLMQGGKTLLIVLELC